MSGSSDVQQHDIGVEARDGHERRRSIARLSDDRPALGLQPPARGRPEAGVVVDDEDPLAGHWYGVDGWLVQALERVPIVGDVRLQDARKEHVTVHPPAMAGLVPQSGG